MITWLEECTYSTKQTANTIQYTMDDVEACEPKTVAVERIGQRLSGTERHRAAISVSSQIPGRIRAAYTSSRSHTDISMAEGLRSAYGNYIDTARRSGRQTARDGLACRPSRRPYAVARRPLVLEYPAHPTRGADLCSLQTVGAPSIDISGCTPPQTSGAPSQLPPSF